MTGRSFDRSTRGYYRRGRDRPFRQRCPTRVSVGTDLIAQEYGGLGLIALTATLLIATLVAMRRPAAPAEPFESGARTEHKTWVQYRVRYAVIALLFVSFDMEMVFMFPWAVVFRRVGLVAFLDMFLFVAILAAALAYAWKEGVFDWED